jgi:transposase-like protein
MTVNERQHRRFSEEFRREQVKLIEKGERTIAQVSQLYEVKRDNVRRWVKQYGIKDRPEMIVIQTQEEVNRIKDLQSQVLKLNEVIGKMHVELLYKSELLDLARKHLGADFEKKIKP